MKNFLIAFFVFLIWSVFGMWYYSCIVKGLCKVENNQITEKIIENQKVDSVSSKNELKNKYSEVTEDEQNAKETIEFQFPNNLGIIENQMRVIFPDGSSENFKKSVFDFLNNNQEKGLLITGMLNNDEVSKDNNLGIKRANYIKKILSEYGVNSDRISVTSKIKSFSYDKNRSYNGGINFEFENISLEKLKTIESGIENKTLYSGFGSKEFIADKTLQAYALELRNYLEKYPDKNAEIVGHTDSTGDNEANDWYGMQRAKNVKSYLIYQGINSNRLKASSRGEDDPIATNTTVEGRRKNRRIEIHVN